MYFLLIIGVKNKFKAMKDVYNAYSDIQRLLKLFALLAEKQKHFFYQILTSYLGRTHKIKSTHLLI